MGTSIEVTPVEKVIVMPPPKGDSCILIIFGASGDLTRRKLVPALYHLACIGCTHRDFDVLGIGRTPMTSEQFRAGLREAAMGSEKIPDFDDDRWAEFEKRLQYFQGDANDLQFYPKLRSKIDEMEAGGASTNLMYYVSTPSSVATPIIEGLGASGLNHNDKGWCRIVLEKPFGRDMDSARALNRTVLSVFDEENVFRIDHYLGKETVQNILVFRFGNSVFEPVWNRNYVDYVEITAAEVDGIERRAAFYEETGALRDMVANHLLQLLALTAMEPPISFEADEVREQKVQLLRSIRPMDEDAVARRTVRGQYGPGEVNGVAALGYRQEPGVSPRSATETYAAVEFYVDNWRWAGVPFFIRAGKRLSRNLTEIRVHFKRTPQALFAGTPEDGIQNDVITLNIQPDEGVSLAFAAKRPGPQTRAVTVRADFCYKAAFGTNVPAAYHTLLLDVMRGDATLFTRRDEVEAEWRIITPIEQAWSQLPPPKFPNYAAGSDGPFAADELLATEERQWSKVA